MKEIGGYFGLERFGGKVYHDCAIAVNSARNALLYVLKARSVEKLYIPRFLCDTVSELCLREGYAYEEYAIDASFLPVFDIPLKSNEYLYIVNFYGQLTDEQILQYKARWNNIIVDHVQDFFRKPLPGIDAVYSCRKFFGVPDGGYAATDAVLPYELPMDISKDRMKHILGRFEETGSAYYADFQENDESFYTMPLKKMSALTQNILAAIDYDAVRSKRNANYRLLDQMLGDLNSLKLMQPDGPYCYPFYCQNGMEIKKQLAANKIYVATLWPNVLKYDCTIEKDFAENILPLPCDQRYDESDIMHMVNCIRSIII